MNHFPERHVNQRHNEFLGWVGRHCVAVGWEDAEPGQVNATGGFAFSAFIMSVGSLWFLVTAGHIIDDINRRLNQGRELRFAKIIDAWAEGRTDQHPIPFPDMVDSERVPQGHIHQESTGIDYGWFYLRDYYRRLLAGNGIVPLDETAWKSVPEQLDAYNAFGFPDDCVLENRDASGTYHGLLLRPRLIPYSHEPNPPPDFQLPYKRLFFWPDRQANGSVARVKGMSGGPIFGYQFDDDGGRLWLVGVQSSQLDESGLAIACPAEPFGRSFEDAMTAVIEERRLEQ